VIIAIECHPGKSGSLRLRIWGSGVRISSGAPTKSGTSRPPICPGNASGQTMGRWEQDALRLPRRRRQRALFQALRRAADVVYPRGCLVWLAPKAPPGSPAGCRPTTFRHVEGAGARLVNARRQRRSVRLIIAGSIVEDRGREPVGHDDVRKVVDKPLVRVWCNRASWLSNGLRPPWRSACGLTINRRGSFRHKRLPRRVCLRRAQREPCVQHRS
jgi:hypothetical protein